MLQAQAAVEKDWIIITGRQRCITKGENAAGLGLSASLPDMLSAPGKCAWEFAVRLWLR